MWWLLYLHECLLNLGELSIILIDRPTEINYIFLLGEGDINGGKITTTSIRKCYKTSN
jgi:hypothetical protein